VTKTQSFWSTEKRTRRGAFHGESRAGSGHKGKSVGRDRCLQVQIKRSKRLGKQKIIPQKKGGELILSKAEDREVKVKRGSEEQA